MRDCKGTILYVGGFELPDKNAAAHRVMNNAKLFYELGYKVVFCGIDKSLSWKEPPKAMNIGPFESIPLVYPQNALQWLKYLVSVQNFKTIFEQYSDIKIVVAYNLHACHLKWMLRYCHKKNIKIIGDCTEWYENKFSFHPVKFIKCMDTFLSMRILQKKFDGMISISTYLRDYYKKHIKNIVVVPPLIDITDDKWTPIPVESNEKVQFVYSGDPGNTKDKLGQIIQCFHKIGQTDKYAFCIIGITKEQFLEMYPALIDAVISLGDSVQFKGRVSHKDSIEALKKSDYCIFIRDRSRKNMAGFPTKFVECYTSGIHVIANEISDIKQYFPNDAFSVLLPTVDDAQLCRVIENIISQNGSNLNHSRRNGLEDNPFDYHAWKGTMSELLDF